MQPSFLQELATILLRLNLVLPRATISSCLLQKQEQSRPCAGSTQQTVVACALADKAVLPMQDAALRTPDDGLQWIILTDMFLCATEISEQADQQQELELGAAVKVHPPLQRSLLSSRIWAP